jgi:hypothetical protein
VTRHYYLSPASGLDLPEPSTVVMLQLLRAPLIIASILPLLAYLHSGSRLTRLLVPGLLLFSIGGLVPLLIQAPALPMVVVTASIAEIALQNIPAGFITGLLFLKGRS